MKVSILIVVFILSIMCIIASIFTPLYIGYILCMVGAIFSMYSANQLSKELC